MTKYILLTAWGLSHFIIAFSLYKFNIYFLYTYIGYSAAGVFGRLYKNVVVQEHLEKIGETRKSNS